MVCLAGKRAESITAALLSEPGHTAAKYLFDGEYNLLICGYDGEVCQQHILVDIGEKWNFT